MARHDRKSCRRSGTRRRQLADLARGQGPATTWRTRSQRARAEHNRCGCGRKPSGLGGDREARDRHCIAPNAGGFLTEDMASMGSSRRQGSGRTARTILAVTAVSFILWAFAVPAATAEPAESPPEPPPESPEGTDYEAEPADTLEDGSIEIGLGAAGRPGQRPQ